MDSNDAEIKKAKEMIASIEHSISFLKSFIYKRHKIVNIEVPITSASAPLPVIKTPEKPNMYSNKTLSAYLDISEKTLKKYRDSGLIGYSQVADKVWYSQKDVDTFLAKHRNETF